MQRLAGHPAAGAYDMGRPRMTHDTKLACSCGEGPCHADVLLELANKPT